MPDLDTRVNGRKYGEAYLDSIEVTQIILGLVEGIVYCHD